MRIIKRKSNKTYIGKVDKKEHVIYNYYAELDNGRRVAIRTFNPTDLKVLDGVAFYENRFEPRDK